MAVTENNENKVSVRRGDVVTFLPAFRDPGDENVRFVALQDEDGGRVLIEAQMDFPINPTQVVRVAWIEGVTR